ncbi:MAG TPA: signal peptidase II [Anaerolineae bacterium]|jgi:signal peptidase II|nr:signal peptidase II [Anaerolineae bacterium]
MFPFFLIILAFGLDRLSKWWAAAYLAEQGPTQLHPLLILYPIYNRGVAFGLAQGIGPIVGWLSIIIVLGLFLYMRRLPRCMWLMRAGLALLIGGALGNLVDRITAGQVLDFITTPLRPGVFNIADVMIYLGIFVTMAGVAFQRDGDAAVVRATDGEEQVVP